MNPVIPIVARILTGFTIAADIAILAYLAGGVLGMVVGPVRALRTTVIRFITPHARLLAFVVALASVAGSLFYSEIVRYPPCVLCWWQRIFAYPQVILIAMGIVKNDRHAADYSIAFSLAGLAVSIYQYYIQIGGRQFFQCDAAGGISCTQRFPLEFGYVTLPMMGLTAFASLIILMWLAKRGHHTA